MAKPTEAQIKALEIAHKNALANLLQAVRFRYIIYTKLGKNSKAYKDYAQLCWDLWRNWYTRQLKYEKAGAPKEYILKDDWLNPAGNKRLNDLLKKWDKQGEGIGFIPLIIWAVVAIAGFFTAEEIVDELNTTTEEQTALINTSQDICTKNNFTPEECKAFMTQQTEAVQSPGGMLSGIIPKVLFFGGLIYIFVNKDKLFSKSKTQ